MAILLLCRNRRRGRLARRNPVHTLNDDTLALVLECAHVGWFLAPTVR